MFLTKDYVTLYELPNHFGRSGPNLGRARFLSLNARSTLCRQVRSLHLGGTAPICALSDQPMLVRSGRSRKY